MLDAYERYSSRRLVADGQVVHVIKYEPPKAIPTGMCLLVVKVVIVLLLFVLMCVACAKLTLFHGSFLSCHHSAGHHYAVCICIFYMSSFSDIHPLYCNLWQSAFCTSFT